MLEECNALLHSGTWLVVPPQYDMNIVGYKWLFTIKRHSHGSIARYKAGLVVKGFHQRPRVDFKETYSPVLKPATIRLILIIALQHNWHVEQLDISNAFLNGTLDENIYMVQPPGFVDSCRLHHVCLLQKSLYGLRLAPRVWFTCLREGLLHFEFVSLED